MSSLSLSPHLRHSRHRVAVALVLLSLGGAVGVHHGMPMGMGAMADQGICLAVLGGAALLAVGVAIAVGTSRRPGRHDVADAGSAAAATPCVAAPARAGPLYLRLEVLRL